MLPTEWSCSLTSSRYRLERLSRTQYVYSHPRFVARSEEAGVESLNHPRFLSSCPSQDLSAATGLPDSHLKRTLQSLACAKYKILKKDPPTRNVSNTDKFSFNHAFTAPMVRLKIQTIANRVENSEETKETDDRVDKERSQVIEAALVRIMKNRKQLSHSELVNEVTQQLSRRFTPKVTMVKLAMERLIEKDYLERDDKDRKLLRYLVSELLRRTKKAQSPLRATRLNSPMITRLTRLRAGMIPRKKSISIVDKARRDSGRDGTGVRARRCCE